MKQPKEMAKASSNTTATIVALVRAAGGTKLFERSEYDPVKGGYLEITFKLNSPAAFAKWMKEQRVVGLFHRENGDPKRKIRLRTPVYKGKQEERYGKFLDSIKEVERRLGG